MKTLKSFKLFLRKRNPLRDGVKCGLKKKQIQLTGVICVAVMFILVQFRGTPMDERFSLFDSSIEESRASWKLNNLPRGIIEARSDLELRPLWSSSIARLKIEASGSEVKLPTNRYLLAMPVGLKQKENVDTVVQKFLPVNFTIMLFHYDGKVDGWSNLAWSCKAIHVVAQNQTKWWFAKRFLHPSVVAAYDYIFLWDEDLDVKHFHPGSYLKIVKSEGLEISQPALDPNSTEIHHRITIRARTKKVHRRVYDVRGSVKCTNVSWGPPCTGFVEGMAPVFTRAAWLCTWHLLQNDLVYGWGLDMKLGYCAQGDRTKKVGVVDSEYVTHKGIQTLGGGGPSGKKGSNSDVVQLMKKHASPTVDVRAEIRRQSTWELRVFKKRWNRAVDEDRGWVDPFPKGPITRGNQRLRKERRRRQHRSRV